MEFLIIWLVAVVIFALLEAVTYQLVCIWFAIGSIGGFLAAYAGLGLNSQMVIFLILSVLALICLRPLSVKLFKKGKGTKTNVDALVGRDVLITKRVNNNTSEGEGKINGLIWTVRSSDDAVSFEKDEIARIERVEGVKLIVKKKEN
jgi:membrane protein implicated in regulation of membrane protease activity